MWKYIKFLLRDEGGWIGAAIIGAAMLYSAWKQSQTAQQASRTQQQAAREAAAVQLRMYQQTRTDLTPWVTAGTDALGELQALMEAGPGEYEESPYYNFLLEQGTRGLERGAAARGGQLSGAENQALMQYGQNLASTDYDNWLRRYYESLEPWQDLSRVGQAAAAQTGAAGQRAASGQANALLAGGQARAAGQMGAWAPYGNLINWGGQQYANYLAMQQTNQPSGGGTQWNRPTTGYGYGQAGTY